MAKPTYLELLRDARWQKVRLEVMNRAGFACEQCDRSEGVNLQVHHSYYEKGLPPPWEYPIDSLHCLCADCHKSAQNLSLLLKRQLGKINVTDELESVYGFALGVEARSFPMVVLDVFSHGVATGVGAAWGLSAEEVIRALNETSIDGYRLQQLKDEKRARRNG